MSKWANSLYGNAVAGLFVLSTVVAAVAIFWPGAMRHRNLPLLAGDAALTFATAAFTFWKPKSVRSFDFSYLALIYVAVGVLASGGQVSPLVSLYFVIVAGAALFQPFRRVLPIALLAVVFSFAPLLIQRPQADFLAQIFVMDAMMLIVGFLSSFLSHDAREQRRVRGLLEEIFQASSFRSGEDLGQMLRGVVAVLRRLTYADYAVCYLLSEDGTQLIPEAVDIAADFSSDEASVLTSWPVPIGHGLAGWVARTGETVISGDIEQDERAERIPGTPDAATSAVFVPLKISGQVVGVLRLSRNGANRFKDAELHLAEIFARHATFAIENARLFDETGRLYRKMRLLSITDGLTGLYNQRYLDEAIPKALATARETGSPLSVLMIDSDCLKNVNDQFGHAAGDRFLRELAEIMRREVRATDIVVRYAGDEFIILLPDAPAEAAQHIAERIRIAAQQIPLGYDVALAVSIGIATWPDHADDVEGLLQAADQALYRSKGDGRNRCTIYSVAID
ncbi:MAG: sensor domain-containing diguanylate cyclase [Thermaerobacter sp.]|nr:sensor domain-containing diguanylate cyclase [Thermaerobacter sp.]